MLKRLTSRQWLVLVVLGFGIAGFVSVALLFARDLDIIIVLTVSSVLATAGLGAFGVRWLWRRSGTLDVWRGIALGAAVGLAVHPFVWFALVLYSVATDTPLPFFQNPPGLLGGLILLPLLTFVSWLSYGWVSVAVNALAGGIFGYLQSKTTDVPVPATTGKRVLEIVSAGILLFLVSFALIAFVPIPTEDLGSRPFTPLAYDAALTQFDAVLKREEAEPLLPECHSRLMTHGAKTDKVVVMYHGLTNCPRQFWELGQQFYDRGYNVLIARHPYHVYADRDAAHLAGLTAEGYRNEAEESLRIAHGLGATVYVVGLSGGGTLASWVAQNRNDVERVVTLAPFLGSHYAPAWANTVATNILGRLPCITLGGTTEITHAYPGNNTCAIAQSMRLGQAVIRQAADSAPAAKSMVLVTNDNDDVVDNDMSRSLLQTWQNKGASATGFVIGAEYDLPHDIIDMQSPGNQPELTYPIVIELVEGRAAKMP